MLSLIKKQKYHSFNSVINSCKNSKNYNKIKIIFEYHLFVAEIKNKCSKKCLNN
jgi:hypothetical protein